MTLMMNTLLYRSIETASFDSFGKLKAVHKNTASVTCDINRKIQLAKEKGCCIMHWLYSAAASFLYNLLTVYPE